MFYSQIYCCTQDLIDTNSAENIEGSLLDDERQQIQEHNVTFKSELNSKERISKALVENNISRKMDARERRETDIYQSDWSDFSDTGNSK